MTIKKIIKKIIIKFFVLNLLILSGLLSQVALAAPVITSGNFDRDGNVIVALKDEKMGKVPQLIRIKKNSAKVESLSVPNEFTGKEIRSLIRRDDGLLAFIQRTIESGGKPEIWQYQKSWKKLHAFDCTDFDQIKIAGKKFVLTCYRHLPDGKEETEVLSFELKGKVINNEQLIDFSLQEHQDPIGRQILTFKGELYQWQELEIRSLDQSSGKTLTAAQLIR